jgi:ADP-ribose pyrophosphatase YjhB (NUDIX family)
MVISAGFVEPGETIDRAVIHEVQEETGIETIVQGSAGFSNVILGDISDNMVTFICIATHVDQLLVPQLNEIYEALLDESCCVKLRSKLFCHKT